MNFDSPIVRILIASLISTAVLGFGVRGTRESPRDGVPLANLRRRTRWPFVFTGILCSLMTFCVAQVSTAFALPGTTANTTFAAFVLFGIVGGIILLRVGLRGRYVGDHPYCNHCGFDLFGKPADSTICNECGTDLTGAAAIVIGTRQRRLIPMLTGTFFLTLSIALAISVGRSSIAGLKQFSFGPYKPTWWLVREFDSGTIDWAGGNELLQRLMRGKLDAATIEHIAALKPGQQPSQWASIIAIRAWPNGQLSEATMRAHLRSRLAFKAAIDETATTNRIGFTVLSPPLAPYYAGDAAWNLLVADRRCEVNGIALPASSIHTYTPIARRGQRTLTMDEMKIGDVVVSPTPLPLGKTHLKLAETLVGTLAVPGRPILTESVDLTLLDTDTNVSAFALAPPTPDLTSDAMIAESTACTVRFEQHPDNTMKVIVSLAQGNAQIVQGGAFFFGPVVTPTAVSGTVFLRVDGVDTALGPMTLLRGSATATATLDGEAPKGVVEIVLKPTNLFEPGFKLPQGVKVPEIVFRAPVIERVHTN